MTAVLAVVVVNWNDALVSGRALASARSSCPVLPILVDNGSGEDATAAVRAACPDAVVERLPANRGYAAAANHGVECALRRGATHLLILNNDAELAADALDALVAADRRAPGRLLAPVIVYRDDPATVWSGGGYLQPPCVRNHHLGLGEPLAAHQQPRRVEWATGCALWVSADTWRRIGPLDEAFFLYGEDVDWCLRAAAVGVETWLIPAAVVCHEVSRTTGRLPTATIRYYAYRNHFRLAFRHSRGGHRLAVSAELVWTLGKIAMRTLAFPAYRHDPWYHARTRGIWDFIVGRWGEGPSFSAGTPGRVVQRRLDCPTAVPASRR